MTTNVTGIPYPKVWQRSVNAPVTVRDVCPDADGDVIPEGSQYKDAPGIDERYQGTVEAPLASECKVETKLTSSPAK